MNYKIRYMKNMALLEDYLTKHPELRAFVSIFREITEAKKSITTISIGERISSNTFLSLLTSRIEAPKIHFSSVGNVPIVLLQNYSHTICSIPLPDVKNIELRSETTEFGRKDYKVYFSCNSHDYSLDAVLNG